MIFKQDKRAAVKLRTQPSMPCIAKKQVNSDYTEGDSLETNHRQIFAITFIDKSITELELRFTTLSHFASRLLFLIPTFIIKVPLDKNAYQQIIEMYGKYLPNKDVIDIDLSSWKFKWLKRDEKL